MGVGGGVGAEGCRGGNRDEEEGNRSEQGVVPLIPS